MRKPYFRECRQCWYIRLGGKDVRLGKDKEEAFKRWHELQREEKPADSGTTVNEVVAAFLSWVKAHQSPATYGWYCHFLAGPGEPAEGQPRSTRQGFTHQVGEMKLSALKPYHVYRWIEQNGYTQSEAATRSVIRCFNWATDCGKIAVNPVKGLKKPTVTPTERYLHPEQWEKLLARVKGAFRDLILFLRLTGCRPQEARAIEARHLDGASIIFPAKESKGKKRQRVIRLNDQALAIVRRLALKSPEGPIFRNDDDEPWSRNALVCRFQRLTVTVLSRRMPITRSRPTAHWSWTRAPPSLFCIAGYGNTCPHCTRD